MQYGLFPQQQQFVDFTFARCILRCCNIYLPPSLFNLQLFHYQTHFCYFYFSKTWKRKTSYNGLYNEVEMITILLLQGITAEVLCLLNKLYQLDICISLILVHIIQLVLP